MSRRGTLLGILGLALGVSALYFPVARFELWSDDYVVAQLAHWARHDWRLLLASVDAFYRPSTTWTLILDRLIWGHNAGGYHLTNVGLRIGNAVLLYFALRRFRFSAAGAWTVAFLWACSQFSAEPVYTVSARIDELLLASWLAVVVAWPRRSGAWSTGRLAVVGAAVVFGAFSKETWIVTVGLAFALELFHHGVGLKRALVSALPIAALTGLYLILHLTLLPRGESYFSWTLAPLAKFPQESAAFLNLEPFAPVGFRVSPMGLLGTAVIVAVACLVWKHDRAAGTLGIALLVLPQLPTAFVPYLPVRYTSIPYAGFLTLMAAGVERVVASGSRALGRFAACAAAVLAGVVGVVGVLTVRADLDDMARLSAWHTRLLAEAARVAGSLPVGVPIVVVRNEGETPLRELAGSLRGMPKLLYPRGEDPYALTETSALFDWVVEPEGRTVRRCETPQEGLRPGPGRLLLHGTDGFHLDPRPLDDAVSWAARVRDRGLGVRIIRVDRCGRRGAPS